MRKIPSHLEHPLDNIFISLSDTLTEPFHKFNLTPNHITFISMIFGLLSVYGLYKDNIIMFISCYIISYFFDCMDGYYARKYNMVTKFGDYFDHIKDNVIVFLLLIVVYIKYGKYMDKYTYLIILVIIILSALGTTMYLGCQQKYYNSSNTESISLFSKLCVGDSEKMLNIFKWCGCVNLVIVFTLVIFVLYIKYKDR